jgi:hypothetical protein
VTGFDIFDRYDFAANLLIGVLMIGALALGAPLWAAALIVVIGWTGLFIRHFDEFMAP